MSKSVEKRLATQVTVALADEKIAGWEETIVAIKEDIARMKRVRKLRVVIDEEAAAAKAAEEAEE